MKKIIFIVSLFISVSSFAQKSRVYHQDSSLRNSEGEKISLEPEDKRTNFFTGGSLSLGLGSYGFNAGIHPHFGYTLNKWIDVAGVVNFEYNSQHDVYNDKYRSTTFGVGVFTRIYPVKFAFIQVQPEYNFITQRALYTNSPSITTKVQAPSLLLGIGYTPGRADKNTFSYFTLMIDVLKKVNSPYVDGYGNSLPIIRAGYNFGLFRKKKTGY